MELWPFVNGRALTDHLKLTAMPLSDMLDVVHFYFDQDLSDVFSPEHADAKDESRKMLYRLVYGHEYVFASAKSHRNQSRVRDFSAEDDVDVPLDFDPLAAPKKHGHYIPPTPFNPDAAAPFGALLDPPLG